MKLTTMHPTNRQTMRKRTVKIWLLQGRRPQTVCRHRSRVAGRVRRHVGRPEDHPTRLSIAKRLAEAEELFIISG
jgi:hypothetical protein